MRFDREYRSLLDKLLDGVITLVAVAMGVRWAMSLLLPVIPFIVGLVLVGVMCTLLRIIWRRHQEW